MRSEERPAGHRTPDGQLSYGKLRGLLARGLPHCPQCPWETLLVWELLPRRREPGPCAHRFANATEADRALGWPVLAPRGSS